MLPSSVKLHMSVHVHYYSNVFTFNSENFTFYKTNLAFLQGFLPVALHDLPMLLYIEHQDLPGLLALYPVRELRPGRIFVK